MERPRYAKAYPDDASLLELVEQFEGGNYRAVREGVRKVLAGDASDAVKTAARELRSRTEPSRLQLVLLGIAAVLVFVLSAYEVLTHRSLR